MIKIKETAKYVGEDLIYMDNYSRINFYKYLKDFTPGEIRTYKDDIEDNKNTYKYSDIEDPDLDEIDYWKNYGKNKIDDPDLDEMD